MNAKKNEKGSALILVMILILVISVMGASMMFLARSETWSSLNYRMMTQARYAAETGVQAGANYLMFSYSPPDTLTDHLTSYNYKTASPVTLAGGTSPVLLSSISGDTPVYADSSVISQYSNFTQGPLTAGSATLNFSSRAKLLGMRQVAVYGQALPGTVQTWQITGRGTFSSVQNAQVEVTAVLERIVSPMFAYAAFATNPNCDAINFNGHNPTTNSYSSTNWDGSTFQSYGGNIGSNGGTDLTSGSPTIHGSLSTPRQGVGNCTAGNITALEGSTSQVTGGIVQLPQPVNYPVPDWPNPMPSTGNVSMSSSATLTPTISPSGTIGPTYPDVNIQGNATITLTAGTYNFNTISIAGNAKIQIDASLGPVIINIAGQPCNLGTSTTPPSACANTVGSFLGGGIVNNNPNPSTLQINYAGAGALTFGGNNGAKALVDAPYASGSIQGTADFYGAMITNLVTDAGSGMIHYDRNLQYKFYRIGPWMLSSFTWSKF